MELYVVIAISSPEPYSISYDLVGVFRAKETAQDKARQLALRDITAWVHKITVGKEYRVDNGWNSEAHIGGYIE